MTFPNPDQTEAPADAGTGRRARWLRTVDFTRPTKFSTDQERRVRRALGHWSQNASTRIFAEHRIQLEFEIVDAQQLTWTDAFRLLPESSVYTVLDTSPHEARMLIGLEMPLLVVALDRLLGGKADDVPPRRNLTDIDLMLARRLMSTLVEALSHVWFDISETRLAVHKVEAAPENLQVAAGSEPTLAVTFEARLDRTASTMTLLIPYAAIAPVAGAFSRDDEDAVVHDAQSTAAVQERLNHVDVTVRAEVAHTMLTLEQVLALAPGDTVRLDSPADADLTLYVDRTPVHSARAGRTASKRAVQIVGPLEPAP